MPLPTLARRLGCGPHGVGLRLPLGPRWRGALGITRQAATLSRPRALLLLGAVLLVYAAMLAVPPGGSAVAGRNQGGHLRGGSVATLGESALGESAPGESALGGSPPGPGGVPEAAGTVGSPAGRWICHDPSYPDPCHRIINAAGMASGGVGWAVGESGVILHWDGETWQKMVSPTTADLRGVTVPAPDDAWAVGYSAGTDTARGTGIDTGHGASTDEGHGSRRSAGRNSGTGAGHSASTDAGRSAGTGAATNADTDSDALLHWDGQAWHSVNVPGPVPHFLQAIAANDPHDVWAVGHRDSMLHWDGQSWSWQPAPADAHFRDLDLAGDVGWAVGVQTLRYIAPPGPNALFVPEARASR
jgi:hypothetical protein